MKHLMEIIKILHIVPISILDYVFFLYSPKSECQNMENLLQLTAIHGNGNDKRNEKIYWIWSYTYIFFLFCLKVKNKRLV